MIEELKQVILPILASLVAEAISKLWGLRVRKEDIDITSLSQEVGRLLLGANVRIPQPEKARLEVTELEFHLPPPIVPLPPPPPPAPPIPPPPIILPPVSVRVRIL